MDKYLSGLALYGDDFSPAQIEQWFNDEAEAYYELGAKPVAGSYSYHALNWHYGFRHLKHQKYDHLLGIGSAFGDELGPVVDRSKRITILEPSSGFVNPRFTFVKPAPAGLMPFASSSFDLITCFGVLHHIPNVSTVVGEMARCLSTGGSLLLREPIISMGDWNVSRRGLTKRERGIPLHILRDILSRAGLKIVRESKCMFALTSRWKYVMNKPVYNSRTLVWLDSIMAALPIWPRCYHPRWVLDKLRPTAIFYLLTK